MWLYSAWIRLDLKHWRRVGSFQTRWEAQDYLEDVQRENVILNWGQEPNPGFSM